MATTFAVGAVFLPIGMVKGILGKFFIQFGMTVTFSLLVSLFISFTLVPMLASKFNDQVDKLAGQYTGLLRGVLQHRFVTLIIIAVIFVASLSLFPLLGTSSMPPQDAGELNIVAALDSGLTLETAEKTAQDIERVVQKYPQVEYVYTTVKTDNVNLMVKLSDKADRTQTVWDIASKLRRDLAKIPGINLAVNTSSGLGGGGKEVQYHLKGDNFTELQNYAMQR